MTIQTYEFQVNGTTFTYKFWDEGLCHTHHHAEKQIRDQVWDIRDGMYVADLGCFPAETIIETYEGPKQIIDIKKGEKVLSGNGVWRDVLTTFTRPHNGDIYEITVRGQQQFKLSATPNHPILIAEMSEYIKANGSRPHQPRTFRGLIWKRADEIENGDWVVFPRPTPVHSLGSICISDFVEGETDFTSGLFYILQKYRGKIERARNQNPFVDNINITPSFLKLCGLYIAEGSSSSNGDVAFSFGYYGDEIELAHECARLIKEVFDIDVKPSRGDHGLRVRFYSSTISRLFINWFGKGALNKHLPVWINEVSDSMLGYLIHGMILGDGYIMKRTKRRNITEFKYCTHSKKLAYQCRLLFIRMGMIPYINISRSNTGSCFSPNPSYHIIVSERNGIQLLSNIFGIQPDLSKQIHRINHINDEYIIRRITNIEKYSFSGNVYNLEVDGDGSYVAEGVTVHNSACGDYTLTAIRRGAYRVYAFEPFPETFELLRRNVVLNKWQDRCVLSSLAISSDDSDARIDPKTLTISKTGLPIRTTTLDNFIEWLSIPPPQLDWIKIDVETMEIEAAHGMVKTVRKYKPKILVEIHEPNTIQQFLAIIDAHYTAENIAVNGTNSHWLCTKRAT